MVVVVVVVVVVVAICLILDHTRLVIVCQCIDLLCVFL